MTEPVPACLCGLDTNPVASPRMDIHCPKHDAPGGEPELLPCPWCLGPAVISSVNNGDVGDGYMWHVSCADENDCAMMPDTYAESEKVVTQRWNTRVSQPAGWLKDNEIKRLTDERNQLAQQGAELTLAERERCAKIAEHAQIGDGYTGHYVNGFLIARNQIAVAIRNQRDDTE